MTVSSFKGFSTTTTITTPNGTHVQLFFKGDWVKRSGIRLILVSLCMPGQTKDERGIVLLAD